MKNLICDTCELKKICKVFEVIKDLRQEISLGGCIYTKQQKSAVQRIDPQQILDRSAKIRGMTKLAGEPTVSGITVE